MATLFGLGKDEAPTNGDLGSLAYMNQNEVEIDNGRVAVDEYQKAYTAPKIKPTLNLPFSRMVNFDPRVSFSRSSDAYEYSGDSQKAEENLVKYSEQFDNTVWSKGDGSIVTPNVEIAPNGTQTADQVDFAANQLSRVQQNTGQGNGLNLVGSFYLKAPAGQTFTVRISADALQLQDVVVTDVWQRFSTSVLATANGNLTIRNGADGLARTVFIWGAQLEQRDTLTDYQRTTDRIIQRYIDTYSLVTSNKPRFKEIDPVSKERKGLLVEEARTNLLLQSNGFDTASWQKNRLAGIGVGVISPLGQGFKFVAANTNATHSLTQSFSFITGTKYSYSVLAKKAEFRYLQLILGGASSDYANFDLDTGKVVSGVHSEGAFAENLDNGWVRCTLVTTSTATVSGDVFIIGSNNPLLSFNGAYQGDGYSGIYISQAQLEVGSFPTSPIVTGASAVTRAAEVPQVSGSSFTQFYNFGGGSLFTHVYQTPNVNTPNAVFASISNGVGASDLFEIRLLGGTTINGVITNAAGGGEASISTDKALGVSQKIAFAAKNNQFELSANGFYVGGDFQGTLSSNSSLLGIGLRKTTAGVWSNSHISHVSYYPQALSADELAFLTRNTSDE